MDTGASGSGPASGEYRTLAEARLKTLSPDQAESQWPHDAQALVHELRVHQVELELQNEELLRLERERASFESLYDFAPVGYLILDGAGVIVAANLTAGTLLGLHRRELLGRPLEVLVAPKDRDLAYLGRQRLARGDPAPCEFRMLREGAQAFWVRMEGALVTLRGAGAELRVLLTDITRQRQAAQDFQEMEAQLHHMQRMESLGRLAGGVAHELNNVLASILAVTEGLAEGDAAGLIAAACRRGRDVIQGLLVFSRKDAGPLSAVDLNQQVREAAALARAAARVQVEVDLDLDPRQPLVSGNAATLGTILVNLCGNAVDAMPGGGRLTVRTSLEPGGKVLVRIRDTGAGMAPEVLAKATDPFFTTKEPGKGTGLGLAIVHSLVQAHQGRLSLKSEPGQGTQVDLTLTAHAGPPPGPEPSLPLAARGLDLLLVDDEKVLRDTLAQLLAKAGHRVSTAGGGLEALERLAAGPEPDAMILDVRMPGLDGVEVLQRLRAAGNRLPVLLFTGSLDTDLRALVAGTARTGLLAKPASLADLQKAIGRLLSGT